MSPEKRQSVPGTVTPFSMQLLNISSEGPLPSHPPKKTLVKRWPGDAAVHTELGSNGC